MHVFDTKTGKELYKIGNHENWVLATVFGIDSKRFVSAGRDRAAKLIDAQSGAFLENSTCCAASSPRSPAIRKRTSLSLAARSAIHIFTRWTGRAI